MTIEYLLDTNILSEAIRPKPNPSVLQKLQLHQQQLGTATLVIHELLFGYYRLPVSKKRETLQAYIENVVLPNIAIFDYLKVIFKFLNSKIKLQNYHQKLLLDVILGNSNDYLQS
jgi:predicted nucleic acid-binding protein